LLGHVREDAMRGCVDQGDLRMSGKQLKFNGEDDEPERGEVLPAKEPDYDDSRSPVARRTGDVVHDDPTGFKVPRLVIAVVLQMALSLFFAKVLDVAALDAIKWALFVVVTLIVSTGYPKHVDAVMRAIRRYRSGGSTD
jgi:hypothetical protein